MMSWRCFAMDGFLTNMSNNTVLLLPILLHRYCHSSSISSCRFRCICPFQLYDAKRGVRTAAHG